MTPRSAFEFERRLAKLLWEVGRRVVSRAYNALEPAEPEQKGQAATFGWLDEQLRVRL